MSELPNSSATIRHEAKGRHRAALASDFREITEALANDRPLAAKHRDHALTGDWKDHRDCHIRFDVILVYRKPDPETLQLVRLGSHTKLGL